MTRAPGIALMLLLLSPVAALASGMVPFCQYSTNASSRIENARYRLHAHGLPVRARGRDQPHARPAARWRRWPNGSRA